MDETPNAIVENIATLLLGVQEAVRRYDAIPDDRKPAEEPAPVKWARLMVVHRGGSSAVNDT